MSRKSAVVDGEPDVIAHPAFRAIPDCLFVLNTQGGREEYAKLSSLLFNAGRLTVSTHRMLSAYCVSVDAVVRRQQQGGIVGIRMIEQLNVSRRALKLDDLDKPIAAPEGASQNKFARHGFASKSRAALSSRRA